MSSEDRDLALSLLTRRFFDSMGYYTELKVPIFVPIYGDAFQRSSASDVDIAGIRFDLDFEPSIAIGEAKSPDEKALEEILKIRSIAEYVRSNKRFLIKSRIHDNAREIGRHLEVVCLDESELVETLKRLAVNDGAPSAEEQLSYKQQKSWFIEMRTQRRTQLLANYLESEVWSRTYWENLHNLLYLLEKFLKSVKMNTATFRNFVVFRTASALSISILYLCRQIMISGLSNLGRGVELYVFGGPAAKRERERLRDEVQRASPTLEGFDIPVEPSFLNDLKEVVAYLMLSPRKAILVPQVFGEAVEIISTTDGKFDSTKWSKKHDPIAMKLAKDTLEFVCKACNITEQHQSLLDFLSL